MSNLKSIVAVLTLSTIVGVMPRAQAQKVKVMIAGSSAMWQSMALAAYNSGNCVAGTGVVPPCSHYTGASNFNAVDTRPGAGHFVTDSAGIWIVWDSASNTNVWAYIKLDSVQGTRCYFAQPHCTISVPSFPGVGNKITLPGTIWGGNAADTLPPAAVQTMFTGAGVLVNVGASDIRPEDALFATCRANSVLGGGNDGVDGLGYGINASGRCPTTLDNAHLIGSDILSRGGASHAVAFNITGHDPFTNTAIPGGITTISVGADPIVFVVERDHELSGVKNANDDQLQTLFSGTNCDASVLGLPASGINVYLREPMSGTMNTTEASVFRYPFNADTGGKSQELNVGASNPMTKKPCGAGFRTRSTGTGEEVADVQNSHATDGADGIGYTFFSYGNVSSIAHNANYGYLTVNGVDPLWHQYGTTIDPGQPTTAGNLPSAADLPASCGGAFPCSEGAIWASSPAGRGLSFPNVRNGSYRAWSVVRLVSNGIGLTNAKALVSLAQKFNVSTVPDFVPFNKTIAGTETDPGLALVRSHYQQHQGLGGPNIGPAPVNISPTGDKGGDMGGCILNSTNLRNTSDTTTRLVEGEPLNHCVVVP